MVTVEQFSGPITNLAIAEWLSRAEDIFESYEDDNDGKTLTNKQKIHAAGTSITKNATTDKLHSWWTMNRRKLESSTWDGFRDAVKDKALGSGWRLRSLKDLYTSAQGVQSLDDYFSALENFRFVLSRASNVPEISEFEFKCHLFFRANPGLAAQVLKNDVRDRSFLNDTVDDVKDYLRKYQTEDLATSCSMASTLSEMAAEGMFIVSQAWGMELGNRFSDMIASTFPLTSKTVQHLTKLTIWTNNDANNRLIQGFDTQFNSSQTIRGPPSIYDGYVSHVLDFASDEHISQIQLSRRADLYGISSLEVTTSKGRIIVAGSVYGDRQTYKAPVGWRIVGFHGASYTSAVYLVGANRYPIPRLGFVCAPVA
ncbi:hypothetical protein BJX76DRAFT_354807 [Aspergillus varians]